MLLPYEDMWIAGVLAVLISIIGSMDFLNRSERLVYETLAGFIVGLTAGLVALKWPNDTCYTAIALGGVLDLLQGTVAAIHQSQAFLRRFMLISGFLFNNCSQVFELCIPSLRL